VKNIVRFWYFMAALSALWAAYELLKGSAGAAFWDGAAGLMFLDLARRSATVDFFG